MILIISNRLDAFIERTGQITSWLIFILVLMVSGDVLFRYFFHISSIAEQELQWHILAAIAMFGSAYTFQQGEHVRVDLFYNHYSKKVKLYMDILIPILIIIPFSLFIIYLSSEYVMQSYNTGEISPDPGGLPYRYLVKSLIPIGFILILIQGLAVLLKAVSKLKEEN
ncbi:MAG: TRAP transporter small permease subunit [Arcobacter sp.]|jgi:TRAP-type mannitol/chloroaromatic compound transport system permease small subunit|uniref:TRAP transporter small permease subunit n=1 Tax=unclassified Arcobacter TaxID=2593671 RepID=UPI000229608F|nr:MULTISPECIES: TRAP transporter small permease subunit [unclassified Arcobacter]MDY3201551.1 TRAP transporter small permease subunit [Arcobacter sp.]BAK72903.1 TRAP transporter periplasmic component [Arcobacter sp. L]